MLQLGSFEVWRVWLVAVCIAAIAGAYLALPVGTAAHVLLGLAFGAAVLNIAISEQTDGSLTVLDLALLFITGFAASAYAVPSPSTELLYALLRIALLGLSVFALSWIYRQWRGTDALASGDIALIAVLGAFLPFAIAIYAIAFAITLTIAVVAALHLVKGDQYGLRHQLPIASTLSVLYFCIWVAYRLKSDAIL